nr:class B sortase [Lachnospiraceae bacterium]
GYHNTLIYGHNMKDGSCFGFLPKYADESFGMSHNLIHFDTLYEEGEYELAAVFYSQIDEDELETTEDRAAKDEIILAEGLKNREEAIRKEEEAAMTEGETSEGSPAITHEPVDVSMVTLKDLDLFEDMGDVDIYREEKDNDNGRFRYYYYTDLSDRADFDYYAENLKKNSLYDTGVDIEWGDELLTMSTCSYHVKNGRLVVVAKKID